jgi:hypothetical protein
MTYAYRRTVDVYGRKRVDLFVSEGRRRPPRGYRRCSYGRFVRAWRLRDALTMRALARWQ